MFTRNNVTVQPQCFEQLRQLQSKLKQYRDEPQAFMEALVQTLQAEVRSKFQTKRCITDSNDAGHHVEVPFDETMVKYLWLGEREFEVFEIEYYHTSASVQENRQQLGDIKRNEGQQQQQQEEEQQQQQQEEEQGQDSDAAIELATTDGTVLSYDQFSQI